MHSIGRDGQYLQMVVHRAYFQPDQQYLTRFMFIQEVNQTNGEAAQAQFVKLCWEDDENKDLQYKEMHLKIHTCMLAN